MEKGENRVGTLGLEGGFFKMFVPQ